MNVQFRKACVGKILFLLAFLFAGVFAFAQTRISGTVTDSNGEPLVGASVRANDAANGVVTDIDGKYLIQVSNAAKSLVFSYIGYQAADEPINGRKVINVTLKEDNKLLDEVVVVGYGTMQRKDVTSSITTIKAEDMNVGSFTDPGQLLQGKVPGLVVVQNSDPNGGVNSISLRGASTLRTGEAAEPLYVVDGIPGVNLNLIPPSEIESIDVLRDASATAIYGSKAANGVIMITTKKGSEGVARVSYSGYASWEKIVNDHDMMNADELRAYIKANNIVVPNDLGANTNWMDQVQRTGFAHNHTLSLSGGSKTTTYSASVNLMQRDGAIRGVGNNLFTARAYVETKTLNDRLTIGMGVNGNIRGEWGLMDRGIDGLSAYAAQYYYSPLVPIYNEDGSYYQDLSISQNYNPLSLITTRESRSDYKRLQVNGKASLMIIDGLYLNANFSYENYNWAYKHFIKTDSPINPGRHGEAKRDTKTDVKKLMEIYANYDKTFAEVHKLALMAGYSWEEAQIGDGFGAMGYNFYNDAIGWNNLGLANNWDTDPAWGNTKSTTRMISFYGRANYSFNSKYMLNVAVRRDGSSTFGANNKWATFPSVSAAWRINEENFLKDTGIFDDLKVRVGWGKSGNAKGFDIYTSRFYYQTGSRFNYTDPVTGIITSYKNINAARNVNPDLKWETTTMLNVGLDFAFLNGRINGTIEYYNKTTDDMIWDYPVSTVAYPVGSLTANVGKMRNRGVELTLNATPIQTRDFSWSTSLNLSHNSNKVVSVSNSKFNAGILNRYNPNLPGASLATIQRIIEGQPIGTFYMWEWAGYDENGSSMFVERDEDGNVIGTTASPGEKDRTIVGDAQPDLTMGWNNNLYYKNWDLNLFFTGVFGQKIFNEPKAFYSDPANVGLGRNVMKSVYEQNPNDTRAAMPSDRYLEDGSYFKLSTLTLGYTFRNCFNGWLNNIRVYGSVNNVFTITGYSGRDPEINLGGLEPGVDSRHDHFPRTRQFLVGAQINF